MTDDDNAVVWQWPYSAFGDNRPTGILQASNHQPARLRATAPIELNLRMPGQYFDERSDTTALLASENVTRRNSAEGR